MVYQWKWSLPVPAQAAGERLEQLEQEHGKVTPRIVLDDSRAEDALLHPCFEWDDAAAAELYREEQARFLIRNLTVRVEQEEQPAQPAQPAQKVRAFVSVTQADERAFVGIQRALSEADARSQVLLEAKRAMQSFREKYRGLVELTGVIAAIEAVPGI